MLSSDSPSNGPTFWPRRKGRRAFFFYLSSAFFPSSSRLSLQPDTLGQSFHIKAVVKRRSISPPRAHSIRQLSWAHTTHTTPLYSHLNPQTMHTFSASSSSSSSCSSLFSPSSSSTSLLMASPCSSPPPEDYTKNTLGAHLDVHNYKKAGHGLWFEDGNLVLVAQNTAFRVYRGLLCARSSVFQDMFEFPPPKEGNDIVEGVPVVQTYDSALDMTNFLRALLDSQCVFPVFFSYVLTHTNTTCQLLRTSTSAHLHNNPRIHPPALPQIRRPTPPKARPSPPTHHLPDNPLRMALPGQHADDPEYRKHPLHRPQPR